MSLGKFDFGHVRVLKARTPVTGHPAGQRASLRDGLLRRIDRIDLYAQVSEPTRELAGPAPHIQCRTAVPRHLAQQQTVIVVVVIKRHGPDPATADALGLTFHHATQAAVIVANAAPAADLLNGNTHPTAHGLCGHKAHGGVPDGGRREAAVDVREDSSTVTSSRQSRELSQQRAYMGNHRGLAFEPVRNAQRGGIGVLEHDIVREECEHLLGSQAAQHATDQCDVGGSKRGRDGGPACFGHAGFPTKVRCNRRIRATCCAHGAGDGLFGRSRRQVIDSGFADTYPYVALDAAAVFTSQAEFCQAAHFLAVADHMVRRAGRIFDPDDEAERAALLEELKKNLGDESFTAEYARGSELDPLQAITALR